MNFVTQNTFYHGWNARVNTDAAGHAILTADKLPILHAAVLAACDAIDGMKDGLISDPRACHFDPAVTLCKGGQDPATCLTAAQAQTAREIYQGAHDPAGHQFVISGPMLGSELNWRGVYVPGNPNQPIMSGQISLDTMRHLAFEKPLAADYQLNDFHFDQATFDRIKPQHAIYDATNPDLAPFEKHGGKLILWHGWADPHISPLNTIAYFAALQDTVGVQRTQNFSRLYLFPGMGHCGGGEGPADVDLLSPLMAWVEANTAPGALISRHMPGPDRTRPVFPYPAIATWTGTGSIDDAANFTAKTPAVKSNDHPVWSGAAFFVK